MDHFGSNVDKTFSICNFKLTTKKTMERRFALYYKLQIIFCGANSQLQYGKLKSESNGLSDKTLVYLVLNRTITRIYKSD